MDSFNPTTKTQAALTSALQAATAAGNPEIRPAHLLMALLTQNDGIAAPLLEAVGVEPAAIRADAQRLIDQLPSASGANSTPQLSRESVAALTAAQHLATEMDDEYVSTEHLLYGLASGDSDVAKILLIFAAILAFISSGFEHVVANMTTYGIGLFSGDPNATWPLFGTNLLWVGLGNLVGGALIVGVGYWVIGGSPRTPRATAAAERTPARPVASVAPEPAPVD